MRKKHKYFNRSLLLCIISLLFTQQSFCQSAISLDKMDVLYIGVDNPVSIAVSNIACEDLNINISNGKLLGSGCKYIVRCDTPGTCSIIVSTKKKHNLKQVYYSRTFRVKMIPLPVFRIGPYGSCGLMASKNIIQSQKYVSVDVESFDFDIRYNIDSFRVSIIRNSSEIRSFINRGNKINDDIRNAFLTLAKDDVISFDKIIVHCPFISSSLKNFYESTTYDDAGNKIYNKSNDTNSNGLSLELDPLTLKVFE